jgi:hypothetical protein
MKPFVWVMSSTYNLGADRFIRKLGKNPALQGGFLGANAVKQYAL